MKSILVIFISFFTFSAFLNAQSLKFILQINNLPKNDVIIGSIKGDKFYPSDTLQPIENTVNFNFPANTQPGVYRIVLGQTTYARIMNEPPQQLDFIFNNEDIVFETDFKYPEDSLKIVESAENQVWFEFKQKEKEFQQRIKEVEMEMDFSRQNAKTFETAKWIEAFNQLQQERDKLITQIVEKKPELFASKMIKMYCEPFQDGNLTKEERTQIFKNEFFKNLDFSDEALINSSVYTEKVFKYLMSYAQRGLTQEQQEQEFMKAVDVIVAHTNQNERVYEFILDYLVSGFEKLQMDNLITYIAGKYSGTTCQTDEVSTLERKLLQQKMKIGTVVPDFTLNNINGDPVTLSDVLKEKNLILFWASWCPHCNDIIPQILNWQKSSGLSDFQIITISLDDVEKDWKDKVFEMRIEGWYNLSCLKKWDCPVVLDYNVYATPTLFVVDENFSILAKPITISELMKLKP